MKFKVFGAVGVVLAIVAFASWTYSTPKNILDINSDACTFVAGIRDDFRLRVPVTNTSDSNIQIQEFQMSCACTEVEPSSLELMPGETGHVDFTLDLTKFIDRDKLSVPMQVQIFPVVEGKPRGIGGFKLSGEVQAFFDCTPSRLEILHPSKASQAEETRNQFLKIKCREKLKSFSVACPEEFALLSPSTYRNPSGTCEIEIVPIKPSRETVEKEIENFYIVISGVCLDGSNVPTTKIPVRYLLEGDLCVNPQLVSFGSIGLGDRTSETLTVLSRSGRPIEISLLDHGQEWHAVVANQSNECRKVIQVYGRAHLPGYVESEVSLRVQYLDNHQEIPISIPLSYYGVQQGNP